jgi:hypothetical protein
MPSRLLASSMPRRCFEALRRQLQRQPSTQIRPYPLRRRKFSVEMHVPSVDRRASIRGVSSMENCIELAKREILALVYICYL